MTVDFNTQKTKLELSFARIYRLSIILSEFLFKDYLSFRRANNERILL